MSEDKRIQLEDDPAFYWEMMCKNLARENHRLMERLVKLEDLNRKAIDCLQRLVKELEPQEAVE